MVATTLDRPTPSTTAREPYRLPWSATSTLGCTTRVEYWGDYAGQDPINNYDLNGTCAGEFCEEEMPADPFPRDNATSGAEPGYGPNEEWAREHAERRLAPSKAGERGGPRGGMRFTPTDRNNLLTENAGRCVYCGDKAEEADHIIPRARGGSGTFENGQPTCRWCNRSKGAWYGPYPKRGGLVFPIMLAGLRRRRLRSNRRRRR
jgi:5-methylcytosine-specific restriction endonuclease McrA